MQASFGNVTTTTLSDALYTEGFRDKWNIRKDQIEVCRDCELRYVCTDCRAYLSDTSNMFSKPFKCSYNPYTAEWEKQGSIPQLTVSLDS